MTQSLQRQQTQRQRQKYIDKDKDNNNKVDKKNNHLLLVCDPSSTSPPTIASENKQNEYWPLQHIDYYYDYDTVIELNKEEVRATTIIESYIITPCISPTIFSAITTENHTTEDEEESTEASCLTATVSI